MTVETADILPFAFPENKPAAKLDPMKNYLFALRFLPGRKLHQEQVAKQVSAVKAIAARLGDCGACHPNHKALLLEWREAFVGLYGLPYHELPAQELAEFRLFMRYAINLNSVVW